MNGYQAVKAVQKNIQQFVDSNAQNGNSNSDESKKVSDSRVAHFDVIILDLCMPIMDGYEACRQITTIYNQFNEEQSRLRDLSSASNSSE